MNKKVIKIKSDSDIFLRELLSEDVTEDYVSWLNDPEVNLFLESRFIRHTVSNVSRHVKELFYNNNFYMFGIFLGDEFKHVGNIKLGPINSYHKRAEIGLMIGDKSVWGKGIATKVIRMVTHFGFSELNLLKISAGGYESNVISKKAFAKVGYKDEGFYCNHVNAFSGREGYWILGISCNDFKK